MTLELRKSVIAALKADGTVSGLVGARVYGSKAPQKPVYPLIKYESELSSPWSTQSQEGNETFITLNIWSKTTDVVAFQIADAVKDVLHRTTLTLDTHSFVLGDLDSQNSPPQSDGASTLVAQRYRFLTQV